MTYRNVYLPPVLALDIDGTLGDYHSHWLSFAQEWMGKPMPNAGMVNDGLPLHKHMRVSKSRYRECKLAFRRGGLKRSMPVYDGARELTRDVRKAGAKIWICTSRPYLQVDNIEPDTREWLRRNGIQYDAFVWGHNKYRELVRAVPKTAIVGVLDDLPEMAKQAFDLGLPITIRDQPYNQSYGYPRIDDLRSYAEIILPRIQEYKRNVR